MERGLADWCGRTLTGAQLQDHHRMHAAFHEKMVVYLNKGYDSGDVIKDRPLRQFES